MPRPRKNTEPPPPDPGARLAEIRYLVFHEWGKTEFSAYFARRDGETVDEAKLKRDLDALNALLARIDATQCGGDDDDRKALIEELSGERL